MGVLSSYLDPKHEIPDRPPAGEPGSRPGRSAAGPACAGLITGSLVVEEIFNLPGLGRYFVTSALQRDYTVVMGVVILYSALIMLLNLAGDVLYATLDPRIALK